MSRESSIRVPSTTPQELPVRWAALLNAGDLDALAALYEPQAVLIAPPEGERISGSGAIRQTLAGLLAMGARISLEPVYCVVAGDLAVGRSRWHLTGTADGKPFEMDGSTVEVYRRQPDGGWLYAIDHPTGAD
ncbi:MAG: DUF4440 domain-containing protein [bacterium]|nr:DUF4440 domain-containing protein [bacterium]